MRNEYCNPKYGGKPTVAFQAVVDHSRRVYSISSAFPGIWNDKSICKHDDFVQNLKKGKIYNDVAYELVYKQLFK